jgi:AhpD family alkylhydroperoxidase
MSATTIPADRIDLNQLAPRAIAAMYRLQGAIELPEELHHLISLRASQINGCAFCVDMHWKDARAAGMAEERLYSLSAWEENLAVYSAAERAALELTEAITRVSDGHVPDEVWQRAAEHYDEHELAHVVVAATTINAWNRMMISSRTQPGHYTPGMFNH